MSDSQICMVVFLSLLVLLLIIQLILDIYRYCSRKRVQEEERLEENLELRQQNEELECLCVELENDIKRLLKSNLKKTGVCETSSYSEIFDVLFQVSMHLEDAMLRDRVNGSLRMELKYHLFKMKTLMSDLIDGYEKTEEKKQEIQDGQCDQLCEFQSQQVRTPESIVNNASVSSSCKNIHCAKKAA